MLNAETGTTAQTHRSIGRTATITHDRQSRSKKTGSNTTQKNNRIRLSKGRNLKEHWSDFILCEIEIRPDVTIENVGQSESSLERFCKGE